MTKKQQYLQALIKPVFGFYKVEFGGNWSGSTAVTGHVLVFQNGVSPLKLSMYPDYKVYMRVWLDKLKDGTYSMKFKTYGDHLNPSKTVSVLHTVYANELWKPYILDADVYNRYEAYHFERSVPTLRIHLKSLPWKQTKVE